RQAGGSRDVLAGSRRYTDRRGSTALQNPDAGYLPVIEHPAHNGILPRGTWQIVDEVDGDIMCAVESQASVIVSPRRDNGFDGGRVRVRVAHGFRPCPGSSELQSFREPASSRHLQRVVVRTGAEGLHKYSAVALDWPQEIIRQHPSGR